MGTKREGGKGQRNLSLILLILIVIVGLFLMLINFITDWLWFTEMGYTSVFFKQLFTEIEVGVPVFVVLAILVNIYLRQLKRGYFKKIASKENTDLKKLGRYTNLISIVFGAVAAFYSVTHLWFEILQFANSTGFDIKDPLFNIDISFYIFKLDFLKQINEMVIGLVILIVAATLIYYTILMTMHTPDVFEEEEVQEEEEPTDYTDYSNDYADYEGGQQEESQAFGANPFEGTPFGKAFEAFTQNAGPRGARRTARPKPQPKPKKHINDNNLHQLMSIASGQLCMLGIIFFLMIGANFLLKQFDLLHSHTGTVYGAGFVDVNITIWVYRILMVLAVIGALTVGYHIKKKQFKKILTIPVIMIAIGALGTGASYLAQSYIVSPDEINKESAYLERNIEYTQYAYELGDVKIQTFNADNNLTAKDIKNNSETINNIRINDYEPVKTFYNQTQSIRQYYQFNDVDVDRYIINGKYTQTYLATREIDEEKINNTWLNRHLKYTHGYGVTLSRVDAVTSSGQPDVLIKNIPPVSSVNEIQIERPEIYFGELTNDYVLVNTSEDEFDYPNGDSNSYNQYEGTAGIKMNLLNRIIFSIRERSLKILVSSNIKGNSKVIINRNVMARVQKIMPYLSYENDPYMVVADGKIYWMVDAYTTSSYYPYSEPFDGKIGGVNYIRNSVKVVVDAYNGNVDFYVVDKNDPIAMTYQKIYPKLFKSFEEMPESLVSHIRYPNTLFEIQANIYARYHMEDVKVFYQNEDMWDLANEIYGTEEQQMVPNYYIVKLAGKDSAEFINSIPYTPKDKQNMTALLVAQNDGEDYGKLTLYQFPKSKTIYGPMQIEAQINQNTEISSDFTLWSSKGTTYRRGNLFVIPIETSLLYVEPVYLEASNSAIPEVKRVIVAYDDKIAYKATLKEALESLFGGSTSSDKPSDSEEDPNVDEETMTQSDWIQKAVTAYDNAQKAIKDGDWANYGKYMDELEKALGKVAN